MWKIQNFSATQILREINYYGFRHSKKCHFCSLIDKISQTPYFWVLNERTSNFKCKYYEECLDLKHCMLYVEFEMIKKYSHTFFRIQTLDELGAQPFSLPETQLE